MLISDCCGATEVGESVNMGICPDCKEHCEYIEKVEEEPVKGLRVKMSDELKQSLISNDSRDHVKEFGNCIGVIEGYIDGSSEEDVDVRWEPSKLRYGYPLKKLIIIREGLLESDLLEVASVLSISAAHAQIAKEENGAKNRRRRTMALLARNRKKLN